MMTSRSDVDFGRGLLVGFLAASIVWFAGVKLAAQTPTVSASVSGVPAGTWYFAVRAFNTVGLQSGDSNIVRVDCETATGCSYNWRWDANTESDLAGYVLIWGAAPGIYTNSKTIAGVVTPGKLPAPPLRIRRTP